MREDVNLELELIEEYPNKKYNLYQVVKILGHDDKGNKIKQVMYKETFTPDQIRKFKDRKTWETIEKERGRN